MQADGRSIRDGLAAELAEVGRHQRRYRPAMLKLPKNALGEAACGYSGRPLLAVCSCGQRRSIAFRKLKTDFGDKTPIYGRPFQCKACQSSDVTLFVFDDPAEFYRMWDDLRGPPEPHRHHSTPDPDAPPPSPWL